MEIKACTFDIFGTCVDWRGSVEKVLLAEFEKKGLTEQSGKIPEIAQAWRDGYSKYNQRVASGAIASEDVQTIDFVHRQILSDMVKQYSLQSVWTEAELDDLNLVWHRLQPWPDTVEGIKALKQICIVSSLSNGNIRLQVDQAKFSNLQWDVLISSELFKSAKPNPKVYLGACKLLNLKPEQVGHPYPPAFYLADTLIRYVWLLLIRPIWKRPSSAV